MTLARSLDRSRRNSCFGCDLFGGGSWFILIQLFRPANANRLLPAIVNPTAKKIGLLWLNVAAA